jgi:hypothetical protein
METKRRKREREERGERLFLATDADDATVAGPARLLLISLFF